jgi:molybdopterin-guanine dinucleotide biosynthesis protein A
LLPDEDAVVCVGCDMPFLSEAALDLLRDTPSTADAVVPRVGGFPEPLFARYGRGCTEAVQNALRAGHLKTAGLLERVSVRWVEEIELRSVDPELSSLVNVNSDGDLGLADNLSRS